MVETDRAVPWQASDADPFIVTATFDPGAAQIFQDLRDTHFPPRLNIVPAHLTLFHTLPGSEQKAVTDRLHAVCAAETAIGFSVDGLRFLGRGVALAIAAPRLTQVHKTLVDGWRAWLTNQDRQAFRPHVTIQNKVDPVAARALRDKLDAAPPAIRGSLVGLDLWRYRNGPWEAVARFGFGDRQTPPGDV